MVEKLLDHLPVLRAEFIKEIQHRHPLEKLEYLRILVRREHFFSVRQCLFHLKDFVLVYLVLIDIDLIIGLWSLISAFALRI